VLSNGAVNYFNICTIHEAERIIHLEHFEAEGIIHLEHIEEGEFTTRDHVAAEENTAARE
jgi:hypothetical protein